MQSASALLKAGVPQMSVLSPLLFNIYVSDLYKALSCVYQYEDDTVLLSRHLNFNIAIDMLQRDSVAVMDWYHSNQISAKRNKTKLVCFWNLLKVVNLNASLLLHESCCVPRSYVLIEYVDSVKYLGLFFFLLHSDAVFGFGELLFMCIFRSRSCATSPHWLRRTWHRTC